ncbi:MAG: hypothetical protein H7Z21_07460 [Hymenobacter sp.]|nr:hypothetical protein [Hymenobacter sp.]
MKFTREADFRQERDFGAKVGATFEFLAAHWRPLGKCVLYFVVPPALLMGVAMGLAQTQVLGLPGKSPVTQAEQLARLGNLSSLGATYWLGLLAMLISYVLLGATVYGYVRVQLALPLGQDVTPRLVWEQVRRLAPRLLLSTFVVSVLCVLGCALLLVPGIYLGVALSMVWVIQVFESQGLSTTLSRNLTLVRGKWWSTLGLTFVMSLVIGMLGLVLQLPQYVAMFGKVLHWSWLGSDVLLLVSNILSSVGQMVLYTPLLVALMFQYFNLVERKEGLGLRSLVDSLGNGPAPVAHNAAYRPDDEGEY